MSDDITPKIGDNSPPDVPVLPGDILKSQFLDRYGLTPHGLDSRLDLPEGTIQAIVEGRRRITGWMSQLLGRAFGVSGSQFLQFQTEYDDDMAVMDEEEEHESGHRMELAEKLAGELDIPRNPIGEISRNGLSASFAPTPAKPETDDGTS